MVNLNCNTEEEKVNWILANTALNGMGYESYRATEDPSMPPYDGFNEAMSWAMSKNYFPDKTREEVLCILRKYDAWNDFEKEYGINTNP